MKSLIYRETIIEYCQKMKNEGLTDGVSGNISICDDKRKFIAISPSGMDYTKLTTEDIPLVDLKGEQIKGNAKPSSELQFHIDLYNHREDINAIVHTHSPYISAVAALGIELPAVHYMIGFSGNKVPLAPYQTYGTKELSKSITDHIKDYNAIILENHGLIATGPTISRAYACAEAIEYVAKVYILAKSVGEPKVLNDSEMKTVVEKFKGYGQQ